MPDGCAIMPNMNWDDLRYILAVAKTGSLSKAAAQLDCDHTTVGRRIESAEKALGLTLFVRTPKGYRPTVDAERLLAPMQEVESAVHAVERSAQANLATLDGTVRITSPETFGISYLAPRVAAFGRDNPGLTIELMPVGEILSLGNREAEIAVRFFRSKQKNLVVQKVAEIEYAFYASSAYLSRRPVSSPKDLANHPLLLSTPGGKVVELDWLKRLCPTAQPSFVSTISIALLAAARSSAGIAILPRYLGDAATDLELVPMPHPPREPVWLTIHRDLRRTPRVRGLFEFLVRSLRSDSALLCGD
tara:strand:- start:75082 stop:75993 length:912 start_codon:yes stop_codon:yes gene_type:complete